MQADGLVAKEAVMTPRSWLFVPGDSEAKAAKAAATGADALILDLEDSVAPKRKAAAREIAANMLRARNSGLQYWLRINPLGSSFAADDLALPGDAMPDGIVLPKCESGADVLALAAILERLETASGWPPEAIKILPIATETARSVFNLGTYGTSGSRLAGLTWGAEDLPAAVGATASRNADGTLSDLCRVARALCLAGAAAADVPAIETVYPDFRDLSGLRAYVAQGRRDGFTGMLAIHPAQVPIINEAMTPSEAERAHAAAIIAAFDADPDAGVVAINGKMIDMPHLKQARRLLGRGQA
jgi:citrate lyase subunit beta/citryl-CoA lyase